MIMKVNSEVVKTVLDEVGSNRLVVATKYVDTGSLYELENLGVKYFGENRVQDFLKKYDEYKGNCVFHMIGTLQSNKVHYIIDKVKMIHSINSYKLIDEVDKQAKKHNLVMDILLQVNISLEKSKHGFIKEEIDDVLNYLKEKENVSPRGFMMMAPNIDASDTEKYFEEMENLLKKYQEKYREFNLTELSMGMSNDYYYALKHNATLVRIGRKLFKE